MSAGSFILLMLIMWAVVTAFYTVIFLVGPRKEEEKEVGAGPAPAEKPKPRTEHEIPHAA